MDKDEILELNRKDNAREDEREKELGSYAKQIAFAVGTLVCVLFTVLEAAFADSFSSVPWAIYFSMTGTESVVKFVRIRKKSDLAIGMIELTCAVMMIAYYIVKLVVKK